MQFIQVAYDDVSAAAEAPLHSLVFLPRSISSRGSSPPDKSPLWIARNARRLTELLEWPPGSQRRNEEDRATVFVDDACASYAASTLLGISTKDCTDWMFLLAKRRELARLFSWYIKAVQV